MSVGLSFVSVITEDPVGLAAFYAGVFGLDPVTSLDSPYFRGVMVGGTILGFSAPKAYELLGLSAPTHERDGTTGFWTFEVDDDPAVDVVTDAAIAAGGTLVKSPDRTYYGAYQSVVLDPDGNAFRINHLTIAEVGG